MKSQLQKYISVILLVIAFGIHQNAVFAQTVKPIKFAAGKTSTAVKGSKTQAYTIRVGAGQTCKIRLISMRNAAMLEVLDAEGMDLTEGSDGRSFEGSFENATSLKINITSKIAYTLNVSIK